MQETERHQQRLGLSAPGTVDVDELSAAGRTRRCMAQLGCRRPASLPEGSR